MEQMNNKIYIDRILYPVTALGPGKRIALWTAGCSRRCPGCANPELWERHQEQEIEVQKLAKYVNTISAGQADGITITGGEPFDQAEEIVELLDCLTFPAEILVFSGYTMEELCQDEKKRKLLERIDVLVDGEYIEDKNDGKAVLRGSSNQRIHYLRTEAEAKYAAYLKEGRKIQNFVYDYKTLSVGIHNPSKRK